MAVGFKVKFCKARKPQTKGTVEARNKIVDWIRAYDGEFETIEELETIVENINKDMNITINQETNMSPTALFYKSICIRYRIKILLTPTLNPTSTKCLLKL